MGATASIAIPMAVSAGAQLFGAHSQAQTNQANLNAAQQHAQYMQQLIGQNTQSGQNPYAAQMQQLMSGMRAPGQMGPATYFGAGGAGMQPPPNAQMPAGPMPGNFGGGPGQFNPAAQGMTPFDGPMVNVRAFAPGAGAPGTPAGGQGYQAFAGPMVNTQGPGTPYFGGPSLSMSPVGGGPSLPGGSGAGIPSGGRLGGFLGQLTNPVPGAMQPMPGGNAQMPAAGAGQMWNYQPSGPGLYNAAQGQAAGNVDASGILSGSNFNTGQDALMQMMRRQLTPSQDPSLSLGLQQQGSGNAMFNNSPLFGALNSQFNFNQDQQIAGLRARAGSLGQLAGTGFGNAEANLRAQLQNNQNVQMGQLASQSYESAQGRALQALGLQSQNQQALNQFNLGASGQQLSAAQSYGQQSLGAAGLGMQGALSNQAMQQQMNLANMQAQNQAGQFNAGQFQSQNQFNAAQGNQYNQLLMQMLSGASGMQQGTQNYNAQLLGILGGVGVPQQQPSPWPGAVGDVSQMAMLYPFLQQMMRGGGGGGGSAGNMPTVPVMPIPQIPQVNYMG